MSRQDEPGRLLAIEVAVLAVLAGVFWNVAGLVGLAIAGAVFGIWLGAGLLFDARLVYAYAAGQLLAVPVLTGRVELIEFVAVQFALGGLLGASLVGRWSPGMTALVLVAFVTATAALSTFQFVDSLVAGIFLLFASYAIVAYWVHHYQQVRLASEIQ